MAVAHEQLGRRLDAPASTPGERIHAGIEMSLAATSEQGLEALVLREIKTAVEEGQGDRRALVRAGRILFVTWDDLDREELLEAARSQGLGPPTIALMDEVRRVRSDSDLLV